jgi:hypothetical protein
MCTRAIGFPPIFTRVSQAITPGLDITSGLVPIPYFGNYDKADVCTIGINPAGTEFANLKTHPVSRQTFGKKDDDTLSPSDVVEVMDFCDIYFEPALKSAKYLPPITHTAHSWFKPLEELLNYFNYSYGTWKGFKYGAVTKAQELHGNDGGLAVHIDVVQWATKEGWSDLGESQPFVQEVHLHNAVPTFTTLLSNGKSPGNFKAIFLDGKTAASEFVRVTGAPLTITPTTLPKNKGGTKSVDIYRGTYQGSYVRGWSRQLSGQWGLRYIQNIQIGALAAALFP